VFATLCAWFFRAGNTPISGLISSEAARGFITPLGIFFSPPEEGVAKAILNFL
jgi:hypothetical protein